MNNPHIHINTKIELVRAAIQRIRDAQERVRTIHGDPKSTGSDRSSASSMVGHMEKEFGMQWVNVEDILDDERFKLEFGT